jgi:hypothetical protein
MLVIKTSGSVGFLYGNTRDGSIVIVFVLSLML